MAVTSPKSSNAAEESSSNKKKKVRIDGEAPTASELDSVPENAYKQADLEENEPSLKPF